jgi:hypothetical protein
MKLLVDIPSSCHFHEEHTLNKFLDKNVRFSEVKGNRVPTDVEPLQNYLSIVNQWLIYYIIS